MAKKDLKMTSSPFEEAFQQVMIDVALTLVNPSGRLFRDKMKEILKHVGLYLNLDCLFIMSSDQKQEETDRLYHYTNPLYIDQQPHITLSQRLEKLLCFEKQDGYPSIIEDVKALNHNHPLQDALKHAKVTAFYGLPLMHDDHLFGYLIMIDFSSTRSWTMTENRILKNFSTLIAHAICREQIDHELLDLRKKALESSEVKDQFLANMSHEIRTPLSGIYNAFYLLDTTELSTDQKSYLDLGKASVDQLSSIVDQVLDLVDEEPKSAQSKLETVNLEEEMIRLYLSQKHLAEEKGLSFELSYDYQLDHDVILDIQKIKQVIRHLLSNAFKFTDAGHVKLGVRYEEHPNKSIRFFTEDTGIGITPDALSNLTASFYQKDSSSKRAYQGIGLGLTHVNDILSKLGCALKVSSTPGQGSVFEFSIPLISDRLHTFPLLKHKKAIFFAKSHPSPLEEMCKTMGILSVKPTDHADADLIFYEQDIASATQIQEDKARYGHPQTIIISRTLSENKRYKAVDLFIDLPLSRVRLYQYISSKLSSSLKTTHEDAFKSILSGYALVVDDNRLNRIALESILLKQGVRSKSANSGLEAIEAVKHEHFDLILMDVQMPHMDGIEATRRIRALGKKYQSIPIIAITANAFFNDYDLMKNAQINDVIFKPIHVEHLSQVLRKFINTGTHIHIPDELYVFDEKDFEMRFLGSEDIAKEVMTYFLEVYQSDLEKIRQAILIKHPQSIIETTHYFKGSCGYLSGKRVVWLLQFMMDQAKNEQLDLMSHCYELLESETKALASKIASIT